MDEADYVQYYCKTFNISPEEAKKLVAIRMPVGEVKEWFEYGFTVDEIVGYSAKGLKPKHIRFMERLFNRR